MPRLRQRLDQIQASTNQTLVDARLALAQAQATLSTADKSILQLTAGAMQTISLATTLLAEIMDGMSFELEIMGQPLPGKLTLKFREEQAP